MSISDPQLWPIPAYQADTQPHFLFIITLPYSGSTALAKILASSENIMLLDEYSGEGQWRIPGLCQQYRWNPKTAINEESIKATWLSIYQAYKKSNPAVDIVVEKSPPNMMRIHQLLSLFNSHSLLAYNRNPYAFCSSSLHRNIIVKNLSHDDRHRHIQSTVENWIKWSLKMKSLIHELNIPLLTYEQFCASPETVFEKLIFSDDIKKTINLNKKIKVKDYMAAKIENYNQIQIQKFTEDEISYITNLLSSHEALLKFYNYSYL
jgi:hypothetical protein